MLARVFAAFLVLAASAGAATAQTCTIPNTFTNGQTASATQVMANFNALVGCFNTLTTTNAQAAGRLTFGNNSQISFVPFNGNGIKINGAVYFLSAALNASNTNTFINGTSGGSLAASTTYYVYVFNNSGTLTIDFSTTGHATSTNTGIGNVGTEIKNGDDTRSLIGMVRTTAAAQFADSLNQRFVLSWFNRQQKDSSISTANSNTTSTTTAVMTTNKLEMLNWANEAVGAFWNAQGFTTGANAFADVGVDGASNVLPGSQYVFSFSTAIVPATVGGFATQAEGYHAYFGVGSANSGGGTFTMYDGNLFGYTRG
jgi:hypothetical protein